MSQDDLTLASGEGALDALRIDEENAGGAVAEAGAEDSRESEEGLQAEDELTFEYKYERARTIMLQNPKYRWVFFHVLKHCDDGQAHVLQDLEEYVRAEPGYDRLNQPPYFPIHWLDQAYALEQQYLDSAGNLYTWGDVEHMTEDEFDDLVDRYAYVTTDVGRAILREFSPAEGIKGLSGESAARMELYRSSLEFARESRSFAQLDRLIRTSEAFGDVQLDSPDITPGVFIDKLASLGGIAYDGGWKITDEGEELLKLLENE